MSTSLLGTYVFGVLLVFTYYTHPMAMRSYHPLLRSKIVLGAVVRSVAWPIFLLLAILRNV
jgi:hypothetical protein